ncbi:MAG: response regulator, partial [Acidobacteriota bacterium]
MSPDVLAHIFEPFFTTKGAGKGTGLGLAVVLGLVEQNGGHIHVDTVPQRGTEFTVALPVVDAVLSVVAEVRGNAPRGGGEMILVVEDEEPVRRLAVIALASAGYRVLEASDGRMAIEVFDQHRGQIDLVITDVVMPHLGGRELVTALQAKQPGLRVIYTSGYADDAVLRHGISRAEVDCLAKPYTPGVLLQKARDVIDQAPGHSSTRPPV